MRKGLRAVVLCVLLTLFMPLIVMGAPKLAEEMEAETKTIAEAYFLALSRGVLELSANEQDSGVLTASVTPSVPDRAEILYHWSSMDPAVVMVSDTGDQAAVTPVHGGTAWVTVVATSPAWEGELRAECEVRVYEPVRCISLSTGLLTLRADGSDQSTARLAHAVEPSTHTETMSWRVEQPDEVIAFDAASGQVRALRAGTAHIVAEASGGASARCRVLVRGVETPAPEETPIHADVSAPVVSSARVPYALQATQPKDMADLSLPALEARDLGDGDPAETPPSQESEASVLSGSPEQAPTDGIGLGELVTAIGLLVDDEPVFLLPSRGEEGTTDDGRLIWRSSDRRIARVDEQGRVHPVAVGKATITVSTTEGESASSVVTVYRREALSARLRTKSTVSLTLGETLLPSVTFAPMHSYATLYWYSLEPSVATVDPVSGLITALSKGTARIAAESPELPEAALALTVEVVAPITALRMYADSERDDTSWLAVAGQSRMLDVLPEPGWDVTTDSVIWSSSAPQVVSVDSRTGEATAHKPGNAVITAKADSGVRARCRVRVIRSASSIELPETRIVLAAGKTRSLKPVLLPADNADSVSWVSGNPAVATVSASGEVAAVSGGFTEIVATTLSGLSVRCVVIVQEWRGWPSAYAIEWTGQ